MTRPRPDERTLLVSGHASGGVAFDRPEQCPITRPVREMECKPFGAALENFIGAEEFGKEVE